MAPGPDDDVGYYREVGPFTDLRAAPHGCEGLADRPLDLARAVTGLIVHEIMAEPLYGWVPEPERLGALHVRPAAALVEEILRLDPRPLFEPRPVERRLVGNCRHFSVVTVALMRSLGIAARARCGFASYFEPGLWSDHWIVEWWDGGRWRQVDSQVDDIQRAALRIDVDVGDLPPGAFLSGGEAWRRCRDGQADPDLFGVADLRGWFEVCGNVVRDAAALGKAEMLPWDNWGLLTEGRLPDDPAALALLDTLAAADPPTARRLSSTDPRLRISQPKLRQLLGL